jgi:hypothetical protein
MTATSAKVRETIPYTEIMQIAARHGVGGQRETRGHAGRSIE